MKILWVSNQIFPDLARNIGQPVPISCGWMYGLAMDLVSKGIHLTVVTTRPNVPAVHTEISGIEYFLIKGKKTFHTYDSSLENHWKEIIAKTNPDVVHIHGTEYALGLALVNTIPNLNYVVSIQGLISVYSRYYYGSIPLKEIKKSATFRDIVRRNTLQQARREFEIRGNTIEKEYFKKVNHIIGRTQWDFDHAKTLNSKSTYHFCNESLRDGFYNSRKWNINTKTNHTIFLSQAIYPIKGLHKMLEALSLLTTEFPDIKVRIAGGNIIKSKTIRDKMALSGYGNYIFKLIRKFNIEEHIQFTGPLNEEQMIKEYLDCHVFVCPSSIENSPNSLGEAQLLAVPCISSYVGGVSDMVEHKKTGLLYRFEEVEMLAQAVRSIFRDDTLATRLSVEGEKVASKRHSREINLKRTIDIYKTISNGTN